MIRKIIEINEEKCNGCGLCASACHEGAIGMVDGKAKLLRDDYCDGLGNCLPVCPTGAITFIEREAAAYDEAAVQANLRAKAQQEPLACGCPGRQARAQHRDTAPVAADCTAYAYAGFHQELMRNKITLIGCPKLDEGDYSEKLTEIIRQNDIKSVTVARMEVPCCGGIEHAVRTALQASGKFLPWRVVTVSTDGQILEP